MHAASLGSLVERLRQSDSSTDAELLERFRTSGDPRAFESIVRRHGPAVLACCRRVLPLQADVEDAFQATFLVLLRGIGSIRRHQALGGWLCSIAHRVALRARLRASRRTQVEQRQQPGQAEMPDLSWREACAILHEELDRLPENYRVPLILCYLEGKTRDEAATLLGTKASILKGRLERGRDRLRDRLTRRGITLSAGLLTTVMNSVTAGGLPSHLIRATLGAVAGVAPTAGVAALINRVHASMTMSLMKRLIVGAIALGLISTGVGLSMWPTPTAEPPRAEGKEIAPAREEEKLAREAPDNPNVVAEMSGIVLDPDGKPVAGAKVAFHQKPTKREPDAFFPQAATGKTDADGRFRFPATVHLASPHRGWNPALSMTAQVPGYGPAATVEMPSPDNFKDCTLRLVKDDVPIQGRIIDLQGKPIAGVRVRPIAVAGNSAGDLGPWLKAREEAGAAVLKDEHRMFVSFPAPAAGLTQEAITDDAGKFTLTGCGRERLVVLRIEGPNVETSLVNVLTTVGNTIPELKRRMRDETKLNARMPPLYSATFDHVAGPEVVLEGVVRDEQTDKPIPNVKVSTEVVYDFGWAHDEVNTTTDAEGKYRLTGLSRQTNPRLEFVPAEGVPYLRSSMEIALPPLGKTGKREVKLKPGVLVTGRITNKVNGQGIQALVEYFAFYDNPELRKSRGFSGSTTVSSAKDGSYTLVTLPGRGIIAARTDSLWRGRYLFGVGAESIAGYEPKFGQFNTEPYYCVAGQFDSLAGVEIDPTAKQVKCDLRFDPGKTARGTIVDPDGNPLVGVKVRGPFHKEIDLCDNTSANFTIPGVNPARAEPYFFQHATKHLGAVVLIKGNEPEGFTVKLQPTATVIGRVLREDEPVTNATIIGDIPPGQLNMDCAWGGFFWSNTDSAGRFKIDGLVPGIAFDAMARKHPMNSFAPIISRRSFKPNEVVDLGDVKIIDTDN